ncbi:Crp/Fnr family transcriptional regulator [Sporosarcina sp. ZBG7A]|uniref:Crp/Fnr family transcriptional regulator n=1 Tax=Sporosarcina sp. ZBG7A TaxID=1582223 RepID=UPI00057AFFFB|nr:Crp/Fnr family transcriptional regulator [Sporosarcina sp. ZBG7A]
MTEHNSCGHEAASNVEMRHSCIATVPIFNHLTAEEMNEIVKTTNSVSYAKGETIYHAGEPSIGLQIVHKGRLKIYRLSETGKEQLVRILGPGDFTGELSLFSESVNDAYAEALEPVEICAMNRETLQQFLLKYPAISLKMLTEFTSRLLKSEQQSASIAMETVETRIAMYLADQTEEQSTQLITLPMTRKDLASHLGTTPETVSRKLAEFEDAGWIEQERRRKIRVLDLDALLVA